MQCNYLPVTFLFFTFSLSDSIDFPMNVEDNSDIESSSDEDGNDFAMLPPVEKLETDMDSDASDDMNDGLVHNLLKRNHLTRICLKKEINRNMCNAIKPQIRNLKNQLKQTGKKGTDLRPTLKLLEASAVPEKWKEIFKSPIDAFRAMFPDDLVLHVTNQTNCYAVQHATCNMIRNRFRKILSDYRR